jgi:hypothetical protein
VTVTNWSEKKVGSGGAAPGLIWEGKKPEDFVEILAAANRYSVVPDPAGSSTNVIKVECNNTDILPAGTTDPRAQALSPSLYFEGSNTWMHTKIFLPKEFPPLQEGKFFLLCEMFGSPAEGSPTWALYIGKSEGIERFYWQRNSTYGFDIPWEGITTPIERGVWNDIYVRLFYANRYNGGRVEMYFNGKQIEFFNPATSFNPGALPASKLLVMNVEDFASNEAANCMYIGQYRKVNTPGMEGTVTIYFWPIKLGMTKASVE